MFENAHKLPVRIYYEDTDAGGIVYHASYIRFAERARSEMIRSMGFQCSDLHINPGVLFVVRHLEASYEKTAKLDELLSVNTEVLTLKNTSFILRQTITRGDDVICVLNVTLVTINENGKPVRTPDGLRQKFEGFLINTE